MVWPSEKCPGCRALNVPQGYAANTRVYWPWFAIRAGNPTWDPSKLDVQVFLTTEDGSHKTHGYPALRAKRAT